MAEQFGIFAASYGIAVVHLLESPVQVVVIAGEGDEGTAATLQGAAIAPFAFNKSTLRVGRIRRCARTFRRLGGYPTQPPKARLRKVVRGLVLGIFVSAADL